MQRVMAFDLSSSCIGVVAAEVDKYEIIKIRSTPIIPPKFDVSKLGYMKTKKHMPTSNNSNNTVYTYWRRGEKFVSKTEKKRRDTEVRHAKNDFIKMDIGRQINILIKGVNPNLILAEQNRIFNGVLTSVLLGEIMGILEGVAATYNIPITKYTVEQVRKHHNVSRLVKEFAKNKTPQELQALPDVTKAALREVMEKKYSRYGFAPQTDDESDACVVFDYWFEYIYKKN